MREKVEIKEITAVQADVEVIFSFASLDTAESFDHSWADLYAQDVCTIKGSTVQGGLGPFGLSTLASEKLEEHIHVFFRVFKAKINTRFSCALMPQGQHFRMKRLCTNHHLLLM